jgi:fluoroquinolone resistance protein
VHLSGYIFSECSFKDCNLSMAQVRSSSFKDIQFKSCKVLGVHFDQCNPFLFEVNFENCLLNLSTFQKMNLKKARFKDCTVHEVDFSDADLNSAVFDNSDLTRTNFNNTNLEKADFSTAYNYSIDPERNKLKKAKFSLQGVAGLLDKYDILIG